jgi:type IV secretory pathway VirB3-like protein
MHLSLLHGYYLAVVAMKRKVNMNEPRSNPVHDALNHQPTLCGIKRAYFGTICVVTMACFIITTYLIFSVVVGFIVYISIRTLSSSDPDYITLFLSSMRLPATYDPGKYTATQVRES